MPLPIRRILLLASMAATAGCQDGFPTPFDASTLPSDCTQVLSARPMTGALFHGFVECWRKTDGRWRLAMRARPAVFGKNGVADPGAKREGDGKTPSGVFALKQAFGEEPQLKTGLVYRQTKETDHWVDDPKSLSYNRWIEQPPPAGVSAEKMRPGSGAYRCGAVIEYNTKPVVPGDGSAIFFHLWSGGKEGTAGCVAMPEPDVRRVLGWLDRAEHPVVVIAMK